MEIGKINLKNMEFSEEVPFIEKFIWTKSNYKLMLGKWKIGIILEAGYQLLKSVENKESCVKLTDQIYFQNMLFPYPYSQPLTNEELECFCRGLKLISNQIENLLQKDSSLKIALRVIQFEDCNIQNEAFTASAIQWASEKFKFPMPQINVYFNDSKGQNGIYLFDFSLI